MRKTAQFKPEEKEIGNAAEFVQNCLTEFGIPQKESMKGTLIAEEAIGTLIAHAAEQGELQVSIHKAFGKITIE